jgi:hypothetical protein
MCLIHKSALGSVVNAWLEEQELQKLLDSLAYPIVILRATYLCYNHGA